MTQETSTVDFVKSFLIAALEEGHDELLTDLFDMYNKVRSKNNLAYTGNIKIDTRQDSVTGGTFYDFNYKNNDVVFGSASSDVISFGNPQDNISATL